MKNLIVASIILLVSGSTRLHAEPLKTISWEALQESDRLSVGKVLPGEPPATTETLRIQGTPDKPQTIRLVVLEDPGVKPPAYAVRGKIRYEDVQGTGYLEMWNYFPDGGPYFTRTLAGDGLLKHLKGSSGWRDFSLPFLIGEGKQRPSRLEINLVLQGGGTVYLGPLRLEQYADAQQALAAPGQWWGERTGGWIGGVGGAVLGCLGGLISFLANRGRARSFVMWLTAAMVLVGVAVFAVGVVAVIVGQPYAVYFPLLLLGGLTAGIIGPTRRTIRKRYEQTELRRLEAMDVATA